MANKLEFDNPPIVTATPIFTAAFSPERGDGAAFARELSKHKFTRNLISFFQHFVLANSSSMKYNKH